MIGGLLELILLSGPIGPTLIVAGYVLWHLGLREPFLLTLATLVVGGSAGWGLNVALEKLFSRKKREP